MTSSRWDNPDGVTPWRSAAPTPVGELFVLPSPDGAVASAIALSSFPLRVHYNAPPPGQAAPYLVVEPRGATASSPTREVRVAVVTSDESSPLERVVRWDEYDFYTRSELGKVINDLAGKLR